MNFNPLKESKPNMTTSLHRYSLLFLCLFMVFTEAGAAAPEGAPRTERRALLLSQNGTATLVRDRVPLASISLGLFAPGWQFAGQESAQRKDAGGGNVEFTGSIPVPGQSAAMAYTERVERGESDVTLRYRFTFPNEARLNGYHVAFRLPLDRYRGRSLAWSGGATGSAAIPQTLKSSQIASFTARELAVAAGTPDAFTVRADRPVSMMAQDNRNWGGNDVEVRFMLPPLGQNATVPAGTTSEVALTITAGTPVALLTDGNAVDRNDTSGWFPFTLPAYDAPFDLSHLNHKPAGKFGFLTVKGNDFIFRNGQPVRFWGVCMTAGANFPTKDQADRIARRLAKFGINMVRTHHMDAPWSQPSLIDYSRADSREFNADALDRLDYFISRLKREGIYVYLDQLVHRQFKPGDGVDAAEKLENAAKPYSNFDPRLIELQKEFSRKLWTHVNPYTGLAYKDDPALALTEFANENDLMSQPVTLEPYRSRLEQRYRQWASSKGIDVPPGAVDFTRESGDILRFLAEVQRGYYDEMTAYLRGIGVKVPMTGSNWSRNAALRWALEDVDFTDAHPYWDHPSENYTRFSNALQSAASSPVFSPTTMQRDLNRPFFVSEWDQPWPNEWRAEMTVWLAAVASLQGWNGLAAYTYRHTSEGETDRLTGPFDQFNDPTRFGLFFNTALLFRRGDVRESPSALSVVVPEAAAVAHPNLNAYGVPALHSTPEVMRVGVQIGKAAAGSKAVKPETDPVKPEGGLIVSETREMKRHPALGYGIIDSPRTQAVYGRAGESPSHRLRDVTFAVKTPFATLALSSMTDAPISASRRLLLTAVGRAENLGQTYNLLHTLKVSGGEAPILVEPVVAEVRLRTKVKGLRVHAVSAEGKRTPVKSSFAGGTLRFRTGPESRTIYYEIAAP